MIYLKLTKISSCKYDKNKVKPFVFQEEEEEEEEEEVFRSFGAFGWTNQRKLSRFITYWTLYIL
ncbi:hypothetical protein V2P54_02460 [Mycoplasmoides gallisepticum]|uniref:hypothetical protein n=1 Tax=Mycoplasmoides gallisepticum TaxID=2096 RepID=UPI003DA1FA8E